MVAEERERKQALALLVWWCHICYRSIGPSQAEHLSPEAVGGGYYKVTLVSRVQRGVEPQGHPLSLHNPSGIAHRTLPLCKGPLLRAIRIRILNPSQLCPSVMSLI